MVLFRLNLYGVNIAYMHYKWFEKSLITNLYKSLKQVMTAREQK